MEVGEDTILLPRCLVYVELTCWGNVTLSWFRKVEKIGGKES